MLMSNIRDDQLHLADKSNADSHFVFFCLGYNIFYTEVYAHIALILALNIQLVSFQLRITTTSVVALRIQRKLLFLFRSLNSIPSFAFLATGFCI